MVLIEDLATRAVTPDLFFVRTSRPSAGTEEFGWLKFFKGMSLVVRAYLAVLPADLPVLFRIFRNIFGRIDHNSRKCAVMDYSFSYRFSRMYLLTEPNPAFGFQRNRER
jgi:hypothetical protein